MTNKQTILIAGATGNIGGGAAVALAKRGARVVLLGRRLETLEAEADSIRVALSEEGIEYQDTDIASLVIDFSDMESVRLAAAEPLLTNNRAKLATAILTAAWTTQPIRDFLIVLFPSIDIALVASIQEISPQPPINSA